MYSMKKFKRTLELFGLKVLKQQLIDVNRLKVNRV